MHGNTPGASVRGIFQARILDWVTISSSRGPSRPRDPTRISCGSCIAGGAFTTEPPGKPLKVSSGFQTKTLLSEGSSCFLFFSEMVSQVARTGAAQAGLVSPVL